MPLGVGHLHQDLTWRHGEQQLQCGDLPCPPSSHQKLPEGPAQGWIWGPKSRDSPYDSGPLAAPVLDLEKSYREGSGGALAPEQESGLWALGCKTCVFWGNFLEGPDCKRNPLWGLRMGGKAGPGPEGRHQGGRQRGARSLEHRRRPGWGGGGLGGVSPRPKKMSGGDGGEEACLTQNLRGGTLQGLLPDLLDGVEVHFCRLRQSCVERGMRPAPDPSSMCSSPLLEASPSGRRECGGDASGSGVGVCERDGVPWAACVERWHWPGVGGRRGGEKAGNGLYLRGRAQGSCPQCRALACVCLGGGRVQASVCAREGVGGCVVRHEVGLGVAWAQVTAVRTLKS